MFIIIVFELFLYSYAQTLPNYTIYPVQGEQYQLPIQSIFNGSMPIDSSISFDEGSQLSISEIYTSNFATVIEASLFSEGYDKSVGTLISICAQTVNGNPNINTNNYSYLFQVNNGYEIFQGTLNTSGINNINPEIFWEISVNSTCYSILYINDYIMVFCLEVLTLQQDPLVEIKTYTPALYFKCLSSNYQANITQYDLTLNFDVNSSAIKTQLTQSVNGNVYLSVGYNSNELLIIYEIQNIIYENINIFNLVLVNQLSRNIFQRDFYLSNDMTLFLLEIWGRLCIYNANNGDKIVKIKCQDQFKEVEDHYLMGVYELQNYKFNGSYYINVIGTKYINTFRYNGYDPQLTFKVYRNKNNQNSQIQKMFLTPQFSVFVGEKYSFAQPGPEYLIAQGLTEVDQQLWFYDKQDLIIATYDNQNNILVSSNSQNSYNIQFAQSYLNGYILTPQSGIFSIKGQFLEEGENYKYITVNISLNSVSNSNKASVYQIQELAQIIQYSPSIYFQGPNLNYYATSDLNTLVLYQWKQVYFSAITPNEDYFINFINLFYLNDYLQIRIIELLKIKDSNADLFVQVTQKSQTLKIYICTMFGYVCNETASFTQHKFIQKASFGYNQISNSFLLAVGYSDSDLINIYSTSDFQSWSFEKSLYTLDYTNSSQSTVNTFEFLQNCLYVITQNPPAMAALLIDQGKYTIVSNQSIANFAPQNLWVNFEAYGPYIFVDNVYELQVLMPVEGSDFLLLQTIAYPLQDAQQQIEVALLYEGIFIVIDGTIEDNVYFYPWEQINSINLQQSTPNYTTVASNFNFTFSTPLDVSFTSEKMYISTTNATVLVYQPASSSINSLYTVQVFENYNNIQSLSSISLGIYDLVSGLLYNQNKPTVFWMELQHNAFFPSPLNLSIFYANYSINLSVVSNNQIQNFYNTTELLINYNQDGIIVSEQNVSLGKINWNSYQWISNFYPIPSFTGPIDNIYSISLQTKMMEHKQLEDLTLIDPSAFMLNSDGYVYTQNITGVFKIEKTDPLTISEVFSFNLSLITCPILFQIDSIWSGSICNYQSIDQFNVVQYNTIIYQFSTENPNQSSKQNIYSLVPILGGQYSQIQQQLILYSQPNQILESYIYIINMNSSIANQSSVSPITLGQYFNLKSFTPIIAQQYQIGYLSISENVFDCIIFYNSYSNLKSCQSTLQQFIKDANKYFDMKEIQFLQVLQTNDSSLYQNNSQNSSNSTNLTTQTQQAQQFNLIPILFVTSQMNFGVIFNFTNDFNHLTMNSLSLGCAYAPYPNPENKAVVVYEASAVDDLIIVPYHVGENLFYMTYVSSNILFGGSGISVCNSSDNLIILNYNLGAIKFPGRFIKSQILQTLSNGQAFTVLSDKRIHIFQLHKHYSLGGQVGTLNIQRAEITLLAKNEYYVSQIQGIFVYILQNNYQNLWLWVGLPFAIIILFTVLGCYFCYKGQIVVSEEDYVEMIQNN